MKQGHGYKKLAECLGKYTLDPFEGSHPKAAAFYFKCLQRLNVDILLNQIEVTSLTTQVTASERQIQMIQDKIDNLKAKHKSAERNYQTIDGWQAKRPETSNDTSRDYHCNVKGCPASFEKESSIKHHIFLCHQPQSPRWKDSATFSYTICDSE